MFLVNYVVENSPKIEFFTPSDNLGRVPIPPLFAGEPRMALRVAALLESRSASTTAGTAYGRARRG